MNLKQTNLGIAINDPPIPLEHRSKTSLKFSFVKVMETPIKFFVPEVVINIDHIQHTHTAGLRVIKVDKKFRIVGLDDQFQHNKIEITIGNESNKCD